jgi:DNA-binding beta-propeller fold protein YncE
LLMLCYNRKFSNLLHNFMILQKLSQRLASAVLAVAALLALLSCGGGGSNTDTTAPRVSGFATRIFLLNSFFGTVIVMNGDTDQIYSSVISLDGGANLISESLDQKSTLIGNPSPSRVYLIDNATETLANTISLPAATESFSMLADNKTGIAAVRNAPVSGQSSGAVLLLDFANTKISATIPVPLVRFISLNKARTKVLAFAENSDSVYVIDTTANTATAVSGFDRPVAAVFTSDDSKAYILNCGPECGGTTASVTLFDTSNNSLGVNIPVSAATVGLIDAGKLYVAGSANNVGQLDVIDTASNTRTQTGIAISNGYHSTIAMASGSNLYIGARNCTNQTTGCLSIYPTSSNQAIQSPTLGFVAGLQPIPSRNLVYVSIGGELVIYETATNAPRPSNQFDVVGFAGDVKQINP